ncbi:MAG: hypothetical protein CEE38_12125 [Planctomycetes bacterium B3_Pla]|nr:MAG: hypothetical protein CEE38_12125 [Planctomycetes bacterium B3_Pla]
MCGLQGVYLDSVSVTIMVRPIPPTNSFAASKNSKSLRTPTRYVLRRGNIVKGKIMSDTHFVGNDLELDFSLLAIPTLGPSGVVEVNPVSRVGVVRQKTGLTTAS